ncbi:MAG: GDP-mannose 4,6-dehydratase [Alphaproteobacteria bacterium]|nr:GDP-mannose 4,6-dehydratase [Alphaproteobacteria bacterium]
MQETRVAVIGSGSFSGSDFVDLLLEDPSMRVLGLSRSPESHPVFLPHLRHGTDRYTFRQAHLVSEMERVIAALDAFEPHYVVNFAAQGEVRSSFDHPVEYFRTNTLAMIELSEALRRRSWLRKYVHISTPEIYGTCDHAVTENQPMNPSSPYAASKAGADMFNGVLHRTADFPVSWVRATNVYGAHQQLYRIMPRTAIYRKLGRILRLDGGGVAVKSYIHIRDVSRGELAVMLRGRPGQVYHLSPDGGISIREVVEMICRMAGADFASSVEIGPERPGQDKAYVLDSTLARTELDWAPRISFEEGVRALVDWVETNWEIIRTLPLDYEFRP